MSPLPNQRMIARIPVLLAMVMASPLCRSEELLNPTSESARWWTLPLSETPSDDLLVELSPDVNGLKFAEWLYGTPESPRMAVAVVIDEANGGFQLFVDQDRDRTITDSEQVSDRDEFKQLTVEAWQVIDNVVSHHERDVVFRLHGKRLQAATLSAPRHEIETLNGLVVRQIDGNARNNKDTQCKSKRTR